MARPAEQFFTYAAIPDVLSRSKWEHDPTCAGGCKVTSDHTSIVARALLATPSVKKLLIKFLIKFIVKFVAFVVKNFQRWDIQHF